VWPNQFFGSSAVVTDSNNGKELDRVRNLKNEALDGAQARIAGKTDPTLIADVPNAVDVDGGSPRIQGGLRGGGGAPAPAGGASGSGIGGSAGSVSNGTVIPRTISPPQPASIPQTGYGLPAGAATTNGAAPAVPSNGTETDAAPQVPTARSGGLGRNLLRSIDDSIRSQQSTSSPSSTPMGPQPYDPAKNTGGTYRGPVPDNPVDRIVQPGNSQKPKPAEPKRREPGGSLPRQRGGSRRTEETFRNDRFHQRNPAKELPRPENPEAPGKPMDPSDFGRTNTPQTPKKPAPTPRTPGRVTGRARRRTDEQRVADKYTNRKYDKLNQSQKDELGKGYTYSRNGGRPTIRRKSQTCDYPEMHLDGNGMIRKGSSPANSRAPSNANDMAKNFKQAHGAEVPTGDQNHHLISVNVWKDAEITKEA
jgi:hypothetical protein